MTSVSSSLRLAAVTWMLGALAAMFLRRFLVATYRERRLLLRMNSLTVVSSLVGNPYELDLADLPKGYMFISRPVQPDVDLPEPPKPKSNAAPPAVFGFPLLASEFDARHAAPVDPLFPTPPTDVEVILSMRRGHITQPTVSPTSGSCSIVVPAFRSVRAVRFSCLSPLSICWCVCVFWSLPELYPPIIGLFVGVFLFLLFWCGGFFFFFFFF